MQEQQNILYKSESYEIVGACFEVYNELGSGFTEPVFQDFGMHPRLEHERLANSKNIIRANSRDSRAPSFYS